jgi:hypothetical protein
MTDATFEDGAERPVRLLAAEPDDLQVIATLAQDAVLSGSDITWSKKRRQFAMLINRFRWEDRAAAERMKRPVERVRAMLVVDDALAVRAAGINPAEKDMVLSLLSVTFVESEDGAGTVTLIFAGDGEIAIDVEAINLTLADVTKPYRAPSGKTPSHE